MSRVEKRFWTRLLLVTLLPTGFHSPAWSAVSTPPSGSCLGVFSGKITELRKDFKHNGKYDVEVEIEGPVRDQCQLGTCHLHSWINTLEDLHFRKTGQRIRFSNTYLTYQWWLYQSLTLIAAPHPDSMRLKFESTAQNSADFIRFAGLVPESAFHLDPAFQIDPFRKQLTLIIEGLHATMRLRLEKVVDSSERLKIVEETQEKIGVLFEEAIGKVPQKITIDGKETTPRDYAASLFPEAGLPITEIQISTTENTKATWLNGQRGPVAATNVRNAEKIIRQRLDQGQVVYLVYEHNPLFASDARGIMSISAFNVPTAAIPLSRANRTRLGLVEGHHAVAVTGYQIDKTNPNKVIKWKILNSWGENRGDGGTYHMYDDYFRTFAKSIYFLGEMDESGAVRLPKLPNAAVVIPDQLNLFNPTPDFLP